MRILHRYIASSFALTFTMALVILTLVMSLGVIFRISDLVARGAEATPVLQIFICTLPSALTLAIPVSALVAVLLVFSRLSADGEITAMRACGISLWQIVCLPAALALALTWLCLVIHNDWAPESHFMRRDAINRLKARSPLQLLEEGRFIRDFPGLTIFVGRRKGPRIYDVRISDTRDPAVKRQISAEWGEVVATTNAAELAVNLYNVRVNPFDPKHPDVSAFVGVWPVRVGTASPDKTRTKQEDDMTFTELLRGIRDPRSFESSVRSVESENLTLDQTIDSVAGVPGFASSYVAIREVLDETAKAYQMRLSVEMQKRFALSMACFSFVLLGVPLGIRSQRKQSSVGVAISLFLMFNFYLFVIVAESLSAQRNLRPDLIVWLPVVISVSLGCWLLWRAD
jgi:lipopolysaccharide export system permease protein